MRGELKREGMGGARAYHTLPSKLSHHQQRAVLLDVQRKAARVDEPGRIARGMSAVCARRSRADRSSKLSEQRVHLREGAITP